MRTVDEMKPLTAVELLNLWQTYRQRSDDPLERTLLCNAAILQKSCRCRGKAVYRDEMEVLGDMTSREMEVLLTQLAEGETEQGGGTFDFRRFVAMKGE